MERTSWLKGFPLMVFGFVGPVGGAGMLALVAWLFRHDIVTRMVRSTGLPRFMASCLLAGF